VIFPTIILIHLLNGMETIKKKIAALKNDLEDKETEVEEVTEKLKQEKAQKEAVNILHIFFK